MAILPNCRIFRVSFYCFWDTRTNGVVSIKTNRLISHPCPHGNMTSENIKQFLLFCSVRPDRSRDDLPGTPGGKNLYMQPLDANINGLHPAV